MTERQSVPVDWSNPVTLHYIVKVRLFLRLRGRTEKKSRLYWIFWHTRITLSMYSYRLIIKITSVKKNQGYRMWVRDPLCLSKNFIRFTYMYINRIYRSLCQYFLYLSFLCHDDFSIVSLQTVSHGPWVSTSFYVVYYFSY